MDNVKLFITFASLQAKKVTMEKKPSEWVMFKAGHFNYPPISKILGHTFTQTQQVKLRFLEKGEYPFRYTIYADGFRAVTGKRIIHVK